MIFQYNFMYLFDVYDFHTTLNYLHLLLLWMSVFPNSTFNLNKGALAGIILGAIACAVTLSAIISLIISRFYLRSHHVLSKRKQCEYLRTLEIRCSE